MAICESGSLIVSGLQNGTVRRWNTETCTMIGDPMCGHEGEVMCVAVDKGGKMIVSGSHDKSLIRWDAKTGNQIGEPMCGHRIYVSSVAISPCGKRIVSGCYNSTVRMWDAVNGEQMGEPFRGHTGGIFLWDLRKKAVISYQDLLMGQYAGGTQRAVRGLKIQLEDL